MNFRPSKREEPEINLIPFIDVLLVVLIFLMLSTTYSKFTELQLTLPTADTSAHRDYPKEMIVAITSDGIYSINKVPLSGRSVESISQGLIESSKGAKDTVVIISADASTRHQAVVSVMEAARRAGLQQVTFATQSSSSSSP
ncbi:MAG: biopolymer transporter ExbD [Rhodoferax sp.]|nr:MAG: biopolymer transporter ExbD [Rhodoferax sp.]